MLLLIFISTICLWLFEKFIHLLGPPKILINFTYQKEQKDTVITNSSSNISTSSITTTPSYLDNNNEDVNNSKAKIALKKKFWCWKNSCLSFLHSCITGIWSTFCLYQEPKMIDDLFNTFTTDSIWLVSFSIGYFIHDIYHMLTGDRSRQSYELLLHHLIVIFCFGLSIFSGQYIGYAVIALIVELNSIFLHMRQLLQLLGYNHQNCLYRINSLINLGTFIIFRIATLSWMTRWLLLHREEIPLGFFTIGSMGLAIMTVMNIILFYRLLQSDFLKHQGASLNAVDSHLSSAKLPTSPSTPIIE